MTSVTFDFHDGRNNLAIASTSFSSINRATLKTKLNFDRICQASKIFPDWGQEEGNSVSIDQGATRRYRLASITVAEDIGFYREFRRHCRRMGVMDLADYPFSWVTAVMPESISAGEAEFGRRALYVRDINNWIKAGASFCTSGKSGRSEQPPPIQLLIPPGRDASAHLSPSLPPVPFLRALTPVLGVSAADNFLIAELDVAGGDLSD